MKHFIYINKLGYVQSEYITDATIKIEISAEDLDKIATCKYYHNWRYLNGKFSMVLLPNLEKQYYQRERQKQCFNLVDNRSPMWYKHLTADQQKELDDWYQAWLDVTTTKVIPTKPEWLK